jgi:hypothetical protein
MPDQDIVLAETPPTIPRLGHLCWFGPHDPPQEAIDSWSKMNPGIIWTLWRDHKAGWTNTEQINARAERNEWNGVCDVIRLEILHRFGGVAVDADSTAVKPLEESDFFESTTALACYEHEGVRPGIVACGFLAAPKGHPFFAECMAEAARADAREMAWKTVGPMLVTRVAQRMPTQIRVLPAKSFIPTHYTGTKAPGDSPTWAIQHFGSTTSYNKLRKWPCQCSICRNMVSMIRPPWG